MNAEVEHIVLAGGTQGPVRGVLLVGGDFLPADAVVSTPTFRPPTGSCCPNLKAPRVARTRSLFAFGDRLGMPASPGTCRLERLTITFISGGTRRGLRAIVAEGRRMPDPSILVTMPTVDDPAMAPPGRHALYALEPVPNLDGAVDWSTERGRAYADLVARVSGFGYPTDVEVEAFVDPTGWQRAGLERGTPFSLAHHFFQTGPFRPGNIDKRAPGLVFVGSRDGARRRRAHGAALRAAGRSPGGGNATMTRSHLGGDTRPAATV